MVTPEVALSLSPQMTQYSSILGKDVRLPVDAVGAQTLVSLEHTDQAWASASDQDGSISKVGAQGGDQPLRRGPAGYRPGPGGLYRRWWGRFRLPAPFIGEALSKRPSRVRGHAPSFS